jgi:hypothetical protein
VLNVRRLRILLFALVLLLQPASSVLFAQQETTQGARPVQLNSSTLLENELPEVLTEAQSEFIRRNSFDDPAYREKQLQTQERVGEPGTSAVEQAKLVRMVYLVPSDREIRRDYTIAVQNAILHLQAFYQNQLGGGYTFSVNSPVVEVYRTSHPASFYSTGQNAGASGFWQSVLADGFALTGGGFDDPNNRWIFYIDADPACGQSIGGTHGVALLAANDFRGLTGQTNVPACAGAPPDNFGVCRWVGGLGHELGHSFDLPHPPGCDQNNTSLCGSHPYNSLMYAGYASFSNTYLLDQDKSSLLATGFFSSLSFATPGANYCSSMTAQDPNPIDDAHYFVRWNYKDFLGREPDQSGGDYWAGQITQCGTDASCIDSKRVDVSGAFFLSIEFQETGFLVYLMHQAAFDTGEHLKLKTFLADTREIGRGVIVNQGEWKTQLETNKQSFINAFVARPQFTSRYPSALTARQFVDALNANTGGSLTEAEVTDLADRLASQQLTRAQVVRAVAENAEFGQRHKNRAFVLMQYFGYLQRNPDDAPNTDFSGFNFWLQKLDNHQGDFRAAEMVRSFIISGEYRSRFGK